MSKRSTRKSQSRSQRTSKSQPYSKSVTPPKKVRGGWLTAALIFIAVPRPVHGGAAVGVEEAGPSDPVPWLWTASVLIALAEIGGAVAMWFWKRWGLYSLSAPFWPGLWLAS